METSIHIVLDETMTTEEKERFTMVVRTHVNNVLYGGKYSHLVTGPYSVDQSEQIEHARQFPTERDEAAAIIHAYTNGFPVPYEPWHHIDNAHNDLLREIIKQLVTTVNSRPEAIGAWFVYGFDTMEYPIALFLDELEARRFVEKLGYYCPVKFWEFGTEWNKEGVKG